MAKPEHLKILKQRRGRAAEFPLKPTTINPADDARHLCSASTACNFGV